MSNEFVAECPSAATLRTLLKQEQLSLSPISKMYRRILDILGETCRRSAVPRNRDSGASVGDNSLPGDDVGGEDPDEAMYDGDVRSGTAQRLTGRGANHLGIEGT